MTMGLHALEDLGENCRETEEADDCQAGVPVQMTEQEEQELEREEAGWVGSLFREEFGTSNPQQANLLGDACRTPEPGRARDERNKEEDKEEEEDTVENKEEKGALSEDFLGIYTRRRTGVSCCCFPLASRCLHDIPPTEAKQEEHRTPSSAMISVCMHVSGNISTHLGMYTHVSIYPGMYVLTGPQSPRSLTKPDKNARFALSS